MFLLDAKKGGKPEPAKSTAGEFYSLWKIY